MQVGASNIASLRFVFQALPVIPLAFKSADDMVKTSKKEWALIVASGLFIGCSALFAYSSLVFIPIMDGTVLFNAQPIWVIIISRTFLKVRIVPLEIAMTCFVFVGVVFICQPAFLFGITTSQVISTESWKGYLLGILNFILAGNANCIVRWLKDRSTAVILVMQTITVLPLYLLYDFVTNSANDPQTSTEWFELSVAVFFSSSARIFATVALKYEQAHIVSAVMSLEIVFSTIFQVGMFGIYPNALGYIGALFVMLGIVGIALTSKIQTFFKRFRMYFARNTEEYETLVVAAKI